MRSRSHRSSDSACGPNTSSSVASGSSRLPPAEAHQSSYPTRSEGSGSASEADGVTGEFSSDGIFTGHVVRYGPVKGERGREHRAAETFGHRPDDRFVDAAEKKHVGGARAPLCHVGLVRAVRRQGRFELFERLRPLLRIECRRDRRTAEREMAFGIGIDGADPVGGSSDVGDSVLVEPPKGLRQRARRPRDGRCAHEPWSRWRRTSRPVPSILVPGRRRRVRRRCRPHVRRRPSRSPTGELGGSWRAHVRRGRPSARSPVRRCRRAPCGRVRRTTRNDGGQLRRVRLPRCGRQHVGGSVRVPGGAVRRRHTPRRPVRRRRAPRARRRCRLHLHPQ